MLKKCLSCSKEFRRKPSKPGKYCSHSCYWQSKTGVSLPGYRKGIKHSEETKQKMSNAHKGLLKGIKKNEEHKAKLASSSWQKKNAGEKSPFWIKDRSLVKYQEERNNPLNKQWRKEVWLRDKFTCRIADNNCDGRIEAHHILGWSEHPELRYKINNGITLCHAHHPKKRAEEKRLIPTFQELVSVSKI